MKKISTLLILTIALLACALLCACGAKSTDIYGIFVSKAPDKTEFYSGEAIDVTGCEITVRTKNGNDKVVPVTLDMVSSQSKHYNAQTHSFSALGQHTLVISYVVDSATFVTTQTIKVSSHRGISATIKTQPDKTSFVENSEIDLSGLVAIVTFSDGIIAERQSNSFTLSNTVAVMGLTEVTLKLDSATLTIPITVVSREIIGIKVTKQPDTVSYTDGDIFNPQGMEVRYFYNDDSIGSIAEYTTVDANVPLTSTTTEKTIMSGTKFSAKVAIEVLPLVINSITLHNETLSTEFFVGNMPDFSAITATVDSEKGTFEVDNSALIFTPDANTALTEGTHVIKVTYKYAPSSTVFAQFEISASSELKVVKLQALVPATNTLFMADEEINYYGLVLEAVYNDGSKLLIFDGGFIEGEEISYPQTAQLGDESITIAFGGKEYTYAITVLDEYPDNAEEVE